MLSCTNRNSSSCTVHLAYGIENDSMSLWPQVERGRCHRNYLTPHIVSFQCFRIQVLFDIPIHVNLYEISTGMHLGEPNYISLL